MFSFLMNIGNYDTRKIGRDDLPNGLTVSTAYTSDEGYETALIDNEGVHPVQRYASKEEAMAGHVHWVEGSKSFKSGTKIRKLGGLAGLVDESEISLSL